MLNIFEISKFGKIQVEELRIYYDEILALDSLKNFNPEFQLFESAPTLTTNWRRRIDKFEYAALQISKIYSSEASPRYCIVFAEYSKPDDPWLQKFDHVSVGGKVFLREDIERDSSHDICLMLRKARSRFCVGVISTSREMQYLESGLVSVIFDAFDGDILCELTLKI